MAHTNRGRVLLGGLFAGLIINIVEFVTHGLILQAEWAETMQALGKPSEMPASAIVIFNLWGFLLGIGAVWLYAGIRTRYGPGPKTALRAGAAAWFLGVALPTLGYMPLELFPVSLTIIAVLVGLAELLVATTAGAWLYKEGGAAAQAAAA